MKMKLLNRFREGASSHMHICQRLQHAIVEHEEVVSKYMMTLKHQNYFKIASDIMEAGLARGSSLHKNNICAIIDLASCSHERSCELIFL